MAREGDSPTPLAYAPARPPVSRPALLFEVGCLSSMAGAILVGVAVPWVAMRGFVYDGAPSLVGAALTFVIGIVIGAILGALIVPAVVLSGYWIIWRIAGRP